MTTDDREHRSHDPFDPDYVRGRRKTGPRLVDLARPLPEPDPGPAVPRPYAPQVRIRPEAVVPPSDNPMRGWRWLGVRLLSRNLWPRDVVTNPVMAYYSGRQRGRLAEDMLGLAPWILWLAFDFWFMFAHAKTYHDIFVLGLWEFVAAGVFAPVWSAVVTAMHLRRSTQNLPVEEMLLTRLGPADIVQGLSVRPIGVQSAALFYWSLATMVFALVADYAISGGVGRLAATTAFVVVLLRWLYTGIAMEVGASFAMRAHLCIRSTLTANLRMLLDTGLVLLLFAVTCGLLGGIVAMIDHVLGRSAGTALGLVFSLLSLVTFAVVAVLMFAGVSFLFASIRNVGGEAMDWCCNYPGEWWVNRSEQEAEGGETRTLLTPWRPLGRNKVVYKADAPMNRT